MDTMQIANSLPMWLACAAAVALVVFQALIFAKHAYHAGIKMGIRPEQFKKAVKSASITSIGPSIVILSGMLSLLISVGGPMAWMRLSLIGSVMFESVAAGFGTSSVGVHLGVDELTPLALTMAVWTMTTGSIGWVIFATFASSRMDKIRQRLSGGDPKMLAAISGAAIVGAFSALFSQHLIKLNKNAFASVLGGIIMAILLFLEKRLHLAFLKEWNVTIAIILAMIITAWI